jgi:hypothetical protein
MLKGGNEGGLVLAEVLCEAGEQTRFGVFFPFHPSNRIPLPNDTNELPSN